VEDAVSRISCQNSSRERILMSVRHAAFVGLAAAVVALVGCARKPPEPVKTPPPVVVVDRPVVEKVTDYEDFAGRTEPYKMVAVKSRVTGYLKTIHFRDGQDIDEGKKLFEIDERPYKAELDKARASLNKAKATLETVTADFSRADEQYSKGVIPKAEFDKAKGVLGEAKADIEAATAAVELADTNLHFCTIHAPFSGRLSKRLEDPDNLVKADETLLTTIVELDQLYVTFDVDERTVMRVRRLIQKGAVTSARVEARVVQIALADDDDFTLSGVITFADNQLDSGTGTLRVRATITNTRLDRAPGYMISPGQFVRIRMPLGSPRDAILVPEKAIGSDQGQRYVFVINDQNIVERRNVHVGQQYGMMRVIEDGVVTTKDRIIVEGLLRVRPGLEVNPKPAAAQAKPTAISTAPRELAPPPHEKK
jgi:multidrug efflux system membrane fusion protein